MSMTTNNLKERFWWWFFRAIKEVTYAASVMMLEKQFSNDLGKVFNYKLNPNKFYVSRE